MAAVAKLITEAISLQDSLGSVVYYSYRNKVLMHIKRI